MDDPFASDIQKTEQSIQKESEVSVSKKTAPSEQVSSQKQVAPPPAPQYVQKPPPQIQPQVANVQALPPPTVPPQPQDQHTCLKVTLIVMEVLCLITACAQAYSSLWYLISIFVCMVFLGLLIVAACWPPMPYIYLIIGIDKIIDLVANLAVIVFVLMEIDRVERGISTGGLGKDLLTIILVCCIIHVALYLFQAIIAFILFRKKA